MAAFQDATAPTYDAFPEWSDGLFERVSEILKQLIILKVAEYISATFLKL